MRCLIGIVVFLSLCYLISEDRKHVNFKEVVIGVAVQFLLAFLILKMPVIKDVFLGLSSVAGGLRAATDAGTKFVFGYVGGGDLPFQVDNANNLFIFGFRALPMIILISALSMLMFYLGILQKSVNLFSKIIGKFSGIGGVLCIVSSAKLVVGQTEAPLLVRPYLSKISKSELLSIITCCLATTSGAAMVLYGSILESVIPNALTHIVAVTVISIPAAIITSRIIIPQKTEPTDGHLSAPYTFHGPMDAISRGTSDGLMLVINIGAMLIVMIACVDIVNRLLAYIPDIYGTPVTLQRIFGVLFTPVAYFIGIPYEEIFKAGELLSTKVVLNEVIAFIDLVKSVGTSLTERSSIVLVYALCGFANFSSIGITISAYSSLVPERNKEVTGMCVKALCAGVISTCLSAAVINCLI